MPRQFPTASIFSHLYRAINRLRFGAIVAAFATALLLSTIEILGRHFDILRWGSDFEEIVRYLSIWIVFLSGSVALRRGVHFRVDYFLDRFFTPAAQRRVVAATQWATVAFLLIVLWYGSIKTAQNLEQTIRAAPIPFAAFYLAIPVGAALMLLELLLIIFNGRNPYERDDGAHGA